MQMILASGSRGAPITMYLPDRPAPAAPRVADAVQPRALKLCTPFADPYRVHLKRVQGHRL